jgi:hypothetical protein
LVRQLKSREVLGKDVALQPESSSYSQDAHSDVLVGQVWERADQGVVET